MKINYYNRNIFSYLGINLEQNWGYESDIANKGSVKGRKSKENLVKR